MKAVQVVIFFAVLIGMMSSGHPDANQGFAPAGVAVFVVFIVTVIPWLIVMMFKQAISDFRRWRSKAARVNAGGLQLRGDGVPSTRVARDSRPRIGQ
jgi:NhaP-type Na+/H+ or K+/H+ antiporter